MIPWRVKRMLSPVMLRFGLFAFRRGLRMQVTYQCLRMGWGNEGWSGDTEYLQEVCRLAATVRGPILECGSGLSTLLLGIIAPGRVLTLEHLLEWKEVVEGTARKHAIELNMFCSPLVNYGAYDWYALPETPKVLYELIICDGPPSGTNGGRFGLLPVARSRFSEKAIILLDDVERSDERAILERWRAEFGVRFEVHGCRAGAYAIIRA